MNTQPRKPWLAGLLTFLAVGLGHLYAGNPQRGLILFLGQGVILALFLPLIFRAPTFLILFLSISCGFAYFIYCLLDAINIARKNKKDYQLKKYNRWYVYLGCWMAASLIIQPAIEIAIKSNIIQAYNIPSGAMMPTLLQGDHILVDKCIYKNNAPRRGDIIIFPYPVDPSQDFIKRLIGLEGDTIEIRDKQLYINNEIFPESYIVNKDPRTIPASQHPRDFFGPITIPKNSLFVMGDNRDNSYDSRYWGVVAKESVKGKVKSLYWSWNREEFKVRWERIGKTIEQVTN